MGFFSQRDRHPDPTDGRADFIGHDSGTRLSLSDHRLPAEVRSQGISFGADCAAVFRIDTDHGIEWWLMSHDDRLLEAISFK